MECAILNSKITSRTIRSSLVSTLVDFFQTFARSVDRLHSSNAWVKSELLYSHDSKVEPSFVEPLICVSIRTSSPTTTTEHSIASRMVVPLEAKHYLPPFDLLFYWYIIMHVRMIEYQSSMTLTVTVDKENGHRQTQGCCHLQNRHLRRSTWKERTEQHTAVGCSTCFATFMMARH
jgi:hypothetical protein